MAIVTSSDQAAPRVPAWKRIGLKLKYAKDSSAHNSHPASNASPVADQLDDLENPGKRRRAEEKPETPAKRSKSTISAALCKASARAKQSTPEQVKDDGDRYSAASVGSQGAQQPVAETSKRKVFDEGDNDGSINAKEDTGDTSKQSRPPTLRKAVSFTADTKVQDGFSAQNAFKTWAKAQKATDDIEAPEAPPEEATSPSKDSKDKEKRKKKKVRSTSVEPSSKPSVDSTSVKKSKKPASDDPVPKEDSAYVQYLDRYYTDKEHWKFNKKHQKDLLKNLFNIFRLPSKHNPAIIQYIAGLQGSARERVAQEAEDVLKAIWEAEHQDNDDEEAADMSLEIPSARRLAYFQALTRHVHRYLAADTHQDDEYTDQKLEDMRIEKEKGERAEAFLRDAFQDKLLPAQPTTTQLPAPEKSTPRQKRKSRTEVSSSSSSSASEESSSSESD